MQIMETSRLILREFRTEDADRLEAVLSDPVTMRFYPAPLTREEVEEWIARNIRRYASDGYGLWAMVMKSSGELVGDCGLVLQDVDGLRDVEIGYHVHRELWGQGLASEAAPACRDYGFAHLSVPRLISLIRPENVQSRRVAEKNGMAAASQTMRKDLLHLVYAITREQAARIASSQRVTESSL